MLAALAAKMKPADEAHISSININININISIGNSGDGNMIVIIILLNYQMTFVE